MNEGQIVNHFNKNAAITTKVGLLHSLKNLIWFNNVDVDEFFPRGFDLRDKDERSDFTQEYMAIKAESLLKIYSLEYHAEGQSKISDKRIQTAMKVTARRLKDLDDIIDDHV